MSSYTERILDIMHELIVKKEVKSERQFAIKIEIDQSQLTRAKNGGEIPYKCIDIISRVFNVNSDYIKTGLGDKYNINTKSISWDIESNMVNDKREGYTYNKTDYIYPEDEPKSTYYGAQSDAEYLYEKKPVVELKPIYNEIIKVPIVQTKARAGYALSYANTEYIETLPTVYVPKQYEKGNYMVFEIEGDSMDDGTSRSIFNRDAVLCKELDRSQWRDKLFFSRYLFVIVYDESCICKQITAHNVEKGVITCHSFNPTYEDFNLNLSEIRQLFYLVKIVERDVKF